MISGKNNEKYLYTDLSQSVELSSLTVDSVGLKETRVSKPHKIL